MMTKRVLSMVLCLCMVLSCLPVMGLVAFADETAPVTVRIEAENASWNKYNNNGTSLGGGSGTYYDLTGLAENIKKDDAQRVVFIVDAPEAGTYRVSVGAKIRMKEACSPYAAVVVNPMPGANVAAIEIPYGIEVGTDAVALESQETEVELVKGRNVIYMVPFTGNQPKNWADPDYIKITGAQAVTHIAPGSVSVAANAGFYYNYGVANSVELGSVNEALVNNANLNAEDITLADLSNVGHATYTIEAPADGYYEIFLNYSSAGSHNGTDHAFALLVDDRASEVKPITGANGTADISTYLSKGVHTLTIPQLLPINAAKAEEINVAWCNLKGLTMKGGLKLAENQDGFIYTGNVLEAERDAYLWRYPSLDNNGNSAGVGGVQPGATKQTYDELAGGAKLNKNQPMLTYYIDVETAGTYTVNTSFRGYTNNDYYMIVSVDDQAYYKAGINGTDPTRNNRWLATANVELTAGRHFVRFITLPNDNGAGWLNVDYTEFAGPGRVKAMKDQKHLSATEAHYIQGFDSKNVDHSGNGAQWANAIGHYKGNSWAAAAGVTTENFTFADLAKLAWFSYTVSVPADGYYDMQTYLRPNTSTFGTGKILLVIDQEYRWVDVTLDKDASKWWIADLTSYLTKGDHVILVSGLMDYTGDSNDWCDMGALTVSGGITKSANPINPLHQGECVLEAESDGFLWRYLSTDQGQVGNSQPAKNKDGQFYNQSYDEIIAEGAVFEKRHQPSVSFVIDVETAGTYDLIASYRGYTDPSYYMVVSIDDETFLKSEYVGEDTDKTNNNAWLLTKVSAELTAGRHIIRLLTLTKGINAGWINVNYLKIEGVADVKKVDPKQTHLASNEAPYILNFLNPKKNRFDEWGGPQWQHPLEAYQGNSCMEAAGVTSENFELNDLGHMGWFSYTLNVPTDGYYDLQTYIRPDYTNEEGVAEPAGTGKILVVVDKEIEWVDVDYNINGDFRWDTIDLSRNLTAGDHTIVISGIVDFSNENYKGDWCDMGALSVSGGITVSETQIDPRSWLTPAVEEYNVFLGDNIGMKFKLDGYAVGDTVEFFANGEKINRINLDGGKFQVNLAAAQMSDEITIKVNGVAIGETYSVREYAQTILNGEYSAELKALVEAMLRYGAEAQTHFNYNNDTENMADSILEAKENTPLNLVASNVNVVDNIGTLNYYGASLIFRNKIAVRFYFTGSVEGCTFNFGEVAEKDGLYYVEVEVASPAELDEAIELVVTDAEGATLSVAYGPMDYIARVYNKEATSASLKALLEDLYAYHVAAVEYVNSIAAV